MGAGLKIGAVYPMPPFNAMPGESGLDIELMAELAGALGDCAEFVHYGENGGSGCRDFEGIFDRLAAGDYDCIAAGAAITPDRERKVEFLAPYLISGQSLAVDTGRLPHVRSIQDLAGLTIGVQRGSTSMPIAQRLVDESDAGRLQVYDYGSLGVAVVDLTTGGCDAVIELAPVLTELVKKAQRASAGVQVVQRGLSVEPIAIAVAPGDQVLTSRLRTAQAELEASGALQRIRRRWLGNPYIDQSLAAL